MAVIGFLPNPETVRSRLRAAWYLLERDDVSQLKRLRKYYGLTQKALSESSGVTLRMIQLYEQGQNDLSKAQAHVVQSLARTLHCSVKDLIS